MKILQVIRDDLDTLYIFTDNPDEDIKVFQEKYKNGDSNIHLWYENPKLTTYKFLWVFYKSISLWYDNQNDIASESDLQFSLLKK